MATPTSFIAQTQTDYSGEKSTQRLPVVSLTAVNLVAQTTLILNLWNAIAAVSLGNVSTREVLQAISHPDVTLPSTVLAQREKKWLIRYHDTSGRKFQSEIPCADLTPLALASDMMDPADTLYTDLKTAFEAVVISPADASAVVMDSVQFVGRKS